jgi:O-antigen ligase
LLAFGIVMTLSRSAVVLKLLREVNVYLILFIALVAASVVWSIEPDVTVRRLLRILTVFLDALALGVSMRGVTSFQRLLRPLFTALMVGSIIFVMMDPINAIEQSTRSELLGAWHGLTTHKNTLGSVSAISFVLWWHAFLSKEKSFGVALAGVVVSAVCLLGSRSSTSLMATVFAAVLLLMLLRSPPSLHRYQPYLIALFVGLLLTYSLAVLNLVPGSTLLLSPITVITGKDLTFSGRTPIWEIINRHIALHPYLGTGYGAYWNDVPGSPSLEMIERLYFYPTEGHNGYLDIVNDLGAVGALVLVGYLLKFSQQGLQIFKVMRPQGALYLGLLFEQLVGNLSESRWFSAMIVDFVIMTIATVAMAKTLQDMRNRPPASQRQSRGTRGNSRLT